MIENTTNIKIAIAGCGSAGRENIRIFLNIDEVEIVACCDEMEDIADFTAREFGIPLYFTDVNEMLEKTSFDAIVVALPDTEHFRVVLAALSEGVNVFCENPLAANYAQAVEMTRAAKNSKLVAMVNDSVFYSPLVSSTAKYIADGRIGQIRYLEASFMQNRIEAGVYNDPSEEKRLLWRLSSAGGSIGAIGELGYSLFNIAAKLCGDPKEISAMISNISGFDEIEEYSDLDLTSGDTFCCSLSFGAKGAASLNGSWFSGAAYNRLAVTVHGDKAAIMFDSMLSAQEISFYKNGKKETLQVEISSMHSLQDIFISAIKGEALPVSDFEYALKMQYYIEESILSSEGGLRFQLD